MEEIKYLPASNHKKSDGDHYWEIPFRDYFAKHSNPKYEQVFGYSAKIKYLEADAMLAARDK